MVTSEKRGPKKMRAEPPKWSIFQFHDYGRGRVKSIKKAKFWNIPWGATKESFPHPNRSNSYIIPPPSWQPGRGMSCQWIPRSPDSSGPSKGKMVVQNLQELSISNIHILIHYLILSYLILSYLILSYLILSYPSIHPSIHPSIDRSIYLSIYLILSYLILSYLILSYLILSYPILSYPILSYPILSYPILSYPILSYPILSYPILSYLSIYLSISINISRIWQHGKYLENLQEILHFQQGGSRCPGFLPPSGCSPGGE